MNAESATSANFENVPSPSYINLPSHTEVVSAVHPVGVPTHFSQFPATATPTPAVCNPLALNE